jgi:hypothetical protein
LPGAVAGSSSLAYSLDSDHSEQEDGVDSRMPSFGDVAILGVV